jgi:hypothetical protein
VTNEEVVSKVEVEWLGGGFVRMENAQDWTSCVFYNNNNRAKGSGEKAQIQELRHRDRTNVEPEMYDHTYLLTYSMEQSPS